MANKKLLKIHGRPRGGHDATITNRYLYITRAATDSYFRGIKWVRLEYDRDQLRVTITPLNKDEKGAFVMWHPTRASALAIGTLRNESGLIVTAPIRVRFQEDRSSGAVYFYLPQEAIKHSNKMGYV